MVDYVTYSVTASQREKIFILPITFFLFTFIVVVLPMSIFISNSLTVINHSVSLSHQPLLSRHPLAIGIAVALAVLTPLYAQAAPLTTDVPTTRLDPIVVTATRSDRTQSDAPVTVQVLDRK